jgi:hypothetical protein
VDLIKQLSQQHPNLKMMLITNFPDAQAQAIGLGALPGFGKRQMGSPAVTELLRSAVSQNSRI